MAQFDVVDMNGKKVSTVELSDAVFGITPNEKAVHEAVVNFLANQRQGTQNTKIRKEVRARSLGARRAPATLVRAPSALPSGRTAVLLWAPSPAATTTPSTRRSSVWLCSAPCLTRLPTAT